MKNIIEKFESLIELISTDNEGKLLLELFKKDLKEEVDFWHWTLYNEDDCYGF